jgi:hypothetical protein
VTISRGQSWIIINCHGAKRIELARASKYHLHKIEPNSPRGVGGSPIQVLYFYLRRKHFAGDFISAMADIVKLLIFMIG